MNLSDVPIEHKYFLTKAVQFFFRFPMKNDFLHERNASNFKIYLPRKWYFQKGFLFTSDRFYFIGGYNIYFT